MPYRTKRPWKITNPAKRSLPLTRLKEKALAEVLTASIVGLTAEATLSNEDGRPRFGSFIKAVSTEDKLEILAVVLDVVTSPPDSLHRPCALGLTREELKREQPHIFALLKTEIRAVNIGFIQAGTVFQHLPPQPPQVHDFVYAASPEEIIAITAELDFLRLLFHLSTTVPSDELIAASIREAGRAYSNAAEREDFLVRAGRAVCQLFRSDYERMLSIVKKIKPSST
ncbi:MAG: hypothetical protein SFV17_12380 [Candidatus Obscuribacter sp.]|nr:hypothetical protein [Candidatus Melainabacteria bacterium]MDX1987478.1 hypothetical protein [Candidatus Obscuribacter sp.]